MAGDWIKMRKDLFGDPSVISMADELGIDEFSIIGRLHYLWSWADSQSRDGHASGVTVSWINRYVQRDGFAQAMHKASWLTVTDKGVEFPNFERHNGQTAKTRGLAAVRQQNKRSKVTEESRSDRDESVTREEKRREEKSSPSLSCQEGDIGEEVYTRGLEFDPKTGEVFGVAK